MFHLLNRFHLFYRKRYTLGKKTILYPSAKIINNLKEKELITVGNNSHIKGELLTFGHGGKIHIGSYCFVGEGTRIWSAKEIIIKDRVLISHNVNIFDSDTHPLSPSKRHQQFKSIISSGQPSEVDLKESPVRIEEDVLIGCMSVILKNTTIGRGAIIGAGSIVTKDVPPWTVVAGNPARIIREIPGEEREPVFSGKDYLERQTTFQ